MVLELSEKFIKPKTKVSTISFWQLKLSRSKPNFHNFYSKQDFLSIYMLRGSGREYHRFMESLWKTVIISWLWTYSERVLTITSLNAIRSFLSKLSSKSAYSSSTGFKFCTSGDSCIETSNPTTWWWAEIKNQILFIWLIWGSAKGLWLSKTIISPWKKETNL